MMLKWDGIKNSLLIFSVYLFFVSCYTPPIRKIPEFNYNKLLERHFNENISEPFPILVQASEENDLSVSDDGYMVYSSNEDGNYDLWLRDLNSILKIKIVEHPSKQYRPFIKKIDKEEYILLYISDNEDINGDIYLSVINPKQIFDLYVNKRSQINFWNYSVNLSNYIENYFQNDLNCRGKYFEDFPVYSKEQSAIYFVSNRCTNKYHLWKISLKGLKPIGKPEIVLEKEIYYLALSNQYLTFSLLENQNFTSKIGFYNLVDKQLTILKPKVFEKELDGIAIKPEYVPFKNLIYFIYISKDTNGNKKIDPYDNASLLAINLEGSVVSQVLSSQFKIYDYQISKFINGSVIYISDNYKQKDIFLVPLEGNVPKKNHPFEQYEFAQKNSTQKDYILALQSVITYFFNHKDYPLIEGFILYDILEYLKKQKNDTEKFKYYLSFYQIRRKENPLLDIFYQIRELDVKRTYNQAKIIDLENQFLSLNIKDPFVIDDFYYNLGKITWDWNQKQAVLYFNKISQDFLFYPDVSYHLFLYEYQKNKQLILSQEFSLLRKAVVKPEILVKVSNVFLDDFRKYRESEIVRTIPSVKDIFIKNYFYYVLAEKFYINNQIKEALEQLKQVQNLENNQYLKLKVLKLKINIYKKLGLENELLSARNEFINTYNKNFNVELDEEEIQALIQSSNEFVFKFRKNAQMLYKIIEDNLKEGFSITKSNLVEIGVLQRDAIKEFCAPNSLAGKLIDDYNYPEYEKRYADLCTSLKNYQDLNKIPIDLVFEANQLMYLASYAYANLINILFINLHQAGIFLDYHRKWSIYYHRLKVDLAVERFNYLLDWQEKKAIFITQEKLTNILIEKDPFVGTIFNDLLYGYREVAAKMAQETFEYSVLYGHAYTLIRKSIERERFYDSLFEKGYSISNSELIKRKQNVLLELKEAEYQLLYILSIEPTNEDAALLLSYLYTYIDYRKEQNILNPPGYIDRLLQFITGIKPKKLSDKIFFRNLYATTFPERLTEKNIKILENTLYLREYQNLNISPEIYLGLAGNYYRIYNYRKSIINFKNLENKIYIFNNNIQKGLYYFYYAKSHFYEGNYDKSIELFDKSFFYFNEVYQESLKEYNIKTLNKESSGVLQKINVFQNRNPEQDIIPLKLNLIIINIYKSLSNFYNNNYSNAIVDLNKAIEELSNINEIKTYNLYNLMALNYLQNYDFLNAIKIAQIALEEAKKFGLSRNDDIFVPQTVGGRFLGLLLNFNEDFSVIGEGRMPFEISSLRSYEISLGLMQNAYDNLGDIINLLNIIQEKKTIIQKNDLDVILGREAYISLINQEANIYYRINQYDVAFSLFQEAYELSYKYNIVKDYYINFKNMYYVIFNEIENQLKYNHLFNNKQKYYKKLNDLYKVLNKFKKEYYLLREKEFISNKKTENPDYKLTNTDKEILLKQVEFELRDFYHIEALIFYYLGIIDNNSLVIAQSIQSLENIINLYNKQEDKNRAYYRIYLNYFKAKIEYQRITGKNDFKKILAEIEDIYPKYIEYGFVTEYIELNQILGDIYFSLNDYKTALSYYKNAMQTIENHSIYVSDITNYESLINKYIKCLWEQKQFREILVIKERFRFYVTNHLFFNSKLVFEDDLTTQLFKEIVQNILVARQLKNLFIDKRIQKENTKQIESQLIIVENRINQYKNELAKLLPDYYDYIVFDEKYLLINLSANQYVYLWNEGIDKCIGFENRIIRSGTIKNKEDLNLCLSNNKNLVLIPDRYIYQNRLKEYYEILKQNYRVVLRSSIFDKTPVFIEKKEDLRFISNLNLFNHSNNTIIEEQDIKELNLYPTRFLLNLSKEGIGLYFKQRPTISKVFLKQNQKQEIFLQQVLTIAKKENYLENLKNLSIFDSTWLVYDFLRHLGISSVIDLKGYLWGIEGYNENNFKEYKKQLAKEHFELGLKNFKDNPSLALKHFSLSNSFDEDLKTKIYLLGALIRTNHPNADTYNKNLKEEVIRSNSKTTLYRYYVMLMNSYAYFKKYDLLLNFVEELKKEYSESEKLNQIYNTVLLLKELSLSKPDYNKIEAILYSDNYDKSFTNIIIVELNQHGFYQLSIKLAEKYSEYKEFVVKNKIYLSLIKQNFNLIKDVLNKDYLDYEIELWKQFVSQRLDYTIDQLRNQKMYNNQLYNFKLKFYQLFKETYVDKLFSLEKFICNSSLCQQLTEIEKAILFHYSLDAIPYDTNNVAYKNLNILIDHYYQESCFKGNIYLNKIISKYVENEEYDRAFEFYNKFKIHYDCIWNQEGNHYIEEISYPLFILRALQYKIDDTLILKLASYNPKLNLLVGDFIKLLAEPENQISKALENFHWEYLPKKFHKNIYDVLLARFLKAKNFEYFQNIAFIKDALSHKYYDYYTLIKTNLREKEGWMNIISFKSKFYQCNVKKNQCIELELNRNNLEKTLRRFYYEAKYFSKNSVNFEELLDLYSKLYFLPEENPFNYLWVDGIHKFAPIKLEKQIYFVFNLKNFDFRRNPYPDSLNQIVLLNTELTNEYNKNLELLIRFKNQFSKKEGKYYVTSNEVKNQYNIFIKLIQKENIQIPLYSSNTIDFDFPQDSFGLFILTFEPIHTLIIFDNYYNVEQLQMINRFNKIYKLFFYDIYFTKPYVNFLIK